MASHGKQHEVGWWKYLQDIYCEIQDPARISEFSAVLFFLFTAYSLIFKNTEICLNEPNWLNNFCTEGG